MNWNTSQDIKPCSWRKVGWRIVDQIHLEQNTGQWKVFVTMVMNIPVPYDVRN
jgi:hypothetical protein